VRDSGHTDLALLDHDQAEDKDHDSANSSEETNKDTLDDCLINKAASLFLHRHVLIPVFIRR
jgi:hypothetical protein